MVVVEVRGGGSTGTYLGTAPSTIRLAFCLLFPMTAFFMSLWGQTERSPLGDAFEAAAVTDALHEMRL